MINNLTLFMESSMHDPFQHPSSLCFSQLSGCICRYAMCARKFYVRGPSMCNMVWFNDYINAFYTIMCLRCCKIARVLVKCERDKQGLEPVMVGRVHVRSVYIYVHKGLCVNVSWCEGKRIQGTPLKGLGLHEPRRVSLS